MAHNLANIANKPAMMYAGETPWHGLGTPLSRPATAAEAIKAAHLDWEVGKVPLHLKIKSRYQKIPHRYGVVRLDETGNPVSTVFGIVAEKYRPLQNRVAFQWFDSIVGQGAAIYHTAGALGSGERIWILAKLPGEIRVVGNDLVEKFLLLSNSHDGLSSVQLKFTPIRVVCQNTLTIALSTGDGARVSHMPAMAGRLELAKEQLGIINVRFETIGTAFEAMAKVEMKEPRLQDYLAGVLRDPADKKDERAMQRVVELRAKAKELFEKGTGNGLPKVRGTLWAAYNGITELIDYRKTSQLADQRLESIWFGSGYHIKARAYALAAEKAKLWCN